MTAESVAAEHYTTQARVAEQTASAAARLWAQVDPAAIAASWAEQVPSATTVVTAGQQIAASSADPYLADMAAELDLNVDPDLRVNPSGFAGRAADGRALVSLLEQPAVTALVELGLGQGPERALLAGRVQLDMMVRSEVADAGRTADGAALTAQRDFGGYTRVLSPPSCSRCVVLAGRWYKWNEGFARHPRCDCRHVPGRDPNDGIATDPKAYFRSLSPAEQDRVFTRAGAEAIRDGADISRVVNARRGMYTAGGRRLTTEATTRRGVGRRVRLMPEQIYAEAGPDRAEAIRLLQLHGYLTGSAARRARRVPAAAAPSPPRVPRRPAPAPPPAPAFTNAKAPSLAEILDNAEPGRLARGKVDPAVIGRAVDGVYAGYTAKVTRVTFESAWAGYGNGGPGRLVFSGTIRHPDSAKAIGNFVRSVNRDADGNLFVVHELLQISKKHQGSGFQAAFNGNLIDWYRRSGVSYIKVGANIDVGGYAWASAGYDFQNQHEALGLFSRLHNDLSRAKGQALRQLDWLDADREMPGFTWTGPVIFEAKPAWSQAQLRKAFKGASDEEIERQLRVGQEFLDRLAGKTFGDDGFPSAYELSQLGRWEGAGKDDVWFGKKVMLGSAWLGIMRL